MSSGTNRAEIPADFYPVSSPHLSALYYSSLLCLSLPLACSTLCFSLWLQLVSSLLPISPFVPQSNTSTCRTCLFEQGAAGARVDCPGDCRLSQCPWPDFSLPSIRAPIWFSPSSLQPPTLTKRARMQVLETLTPVANMAEVIHLLKKIFRTDCKVDQ